jgi:mannose-1-phosphate guanylyltransferase
VILSDGSERSTSFVEKPSTFVGRSINAGHYIFEPSIIDRVRPVNMSIEREVFPAMASEGKLFVMPLEGIWMDIGTPQAFIDCIPVFLENEEKVLIHPSAVIGAHCQIGPNVVIGPGVEVGAACCLRNAVIMANAKIGNGTLIMDSIVGWKSRVGKWARLSDYTILGEGVGVKDRQVLVGTSVLPHKEISRSYFKAEIVI